MSKKEPSWVCIKCAEERGAESPKGHIATFHEDKCGICGEIKMVTESRDFGRSRKLLKIEK